MAPARWELGWKATLGFALAAIAILASGWAAVDQVRAARLSSDRARQTLGVLRAVAEVEIALRDVETGQRGYLLTGEDAYLEPYRQAVRSLGADLDDLQRLLARAPQQQQRLEQVRSLVDAKLAEVSETIELRRTAGAEAALDVVNTHVGKGLMSRIAATLGEVKAQQTALLDRRADDRGERFWWASRVALASSALALLIVAISTLAVNAEARRRAAMARSLRESQERLNVTLRSIGDAVIATDVLGRVVFMNQPAQTLTAWSESAAIGHSLDEVFRVVDERTRAAVESPVARVLREGAVVGLANHSVLLARDGVETPIDDSGAPIRDAGGEMMGVVLVFRDVRERKRQEQEHAQLLREEAARAAAERENRTKDEFLAILSHELRSPLQGILGWLTVLREIRAEPAQRQRALRAIERGVRQQARLVNDILDVSRIVAGKLQVERAPVDVADIVDECVDQAVPEAREKSIELESDVARCGVVLGDRHRLRQAVTNLLTNAIKFTPGGGRILVRCQREDGEVVVTVRDSGQGIDAEFLPHIFDRFTQADDGPRPAASGLGLGLSIVRQIAEVHGGSVRAVSDGLGRGATFELRLPAGPAESARADQQRDAWAGSGRSTLDGVAILIVDDDHDTRDTLALLLAARGATVRHAGSVAEALQTCAELAPDVVVSDISMPDQDGYALIGALRGAGDSGRPIAVALSGFAAEDDRQRSVEAGFNAHVAKPVDLDHLIETILRLIVDDAARR